MRWSRLRQVNLLGMTQKVVSVIEMTHLYGARGSYHVLRPKITIKLLTQSAEKWSCMAKWAWEILGIFSQWREGSRTTGPFYLSVRATLVLGKKVSSRKLFKGQRKKYCVSQTSSQNFMGRNFLAFTFEFRCSWIALSYGESHEESFGPIRKIWFVRDHT